MTWREIEARSLVMLTCNGSKHDARASDPTMTIYVQTTALQAKIDLWRVAESDGWTATSTEHLCPRCSSEQPPDFTEMIREKFEASDLDEDWNHQDVHHLGLKKTVEIAELAG